jgi:PDDEXK-like domain of unknown function (DUF3799)
MSIVLPIPAPGIYPGIPISKYHSGEVCPGPSVSSSGLRNFWKSSAAHFNAEWECNPNRKPRKTSEAMILGGAAHHLLLGEDEFATHFICHPLEIPDAKGVLKPWTRALGSAKNWLAEQDAAGKVVVSPLQLEKIRGMARSLAAHPLIEAGVLRGEIEQSMFALDEETGLWLRARPDAIPNDSGDFADLKTTTSVTDFEIKMTLRSYGYHQQAALTWEICEALGVPFDSWTLVFVESDEPYCVRAVALTDDDLARGRRQNRAMLRMIADCLDSGEWPGPGSTDAEPISLPKTDQEAIDKRLDEIERDYAQAA